MEKNNSNLLITILCGVGACFLCLGIVFLLPAKNTNNLKGNNTELPNDVTDVEEIALGDYFSSCPTGCNCTPHYTWIESGRTTVTWTGQTGTCSGNACVGTSTSPGTCTYYGTVYNGPANNVQLVPQVTCTTTLSGYSCDSCKSGYSPSGSSCEANSTTPTACGSGQWRGSSGCETCTAGYYCTGDGSRVKCSAGYYSSAGASKCTKCNPGYYSSSAGATSCTACPAGQYNTASASTGCSKCPAGKYNTATGSTGCSTCSAGTYSSSAGSTSCSTCSAGTYSSSGASSCTNCPAGQTSSAGASSCTSICTGLSQSACATGEASTYCSFCEGGCKPKSSCSSATPTPTPTPSCESQCANAGSQYNYCMTQCLGYTYPSPTPKPSATPTPSKGICCCNSNRSSCSLVVGLSSCPSNSQLTVATNVDEATCQAQIIYPDESCHTTQTKCETIEEVSCYRASTSCWRPKTQCYKVEDNSCVKVTVDDTSCKPANGYYETYNSCATHTHRCDHSNMYYNGTECITCPDGYKASPSKPQCHIDVAPGYYLVQVGSPGVSACPANTYSEGGTCNYQDGTGCNAVLKAQACKPCHEGETSKIGSASCSPDSNPDKCTIAVWTSATKVSPHLTSAQGACPAGAGDTFTVTVAISGNGCNGRTVSLTGDHVERLGGNGENYSGVGSDKFTVSNGQSFNLLYKATSCCSDATVIAALSKKSGDVEAPSGKVTVSTSVDWSYVGTYCVTTRAYDSHKHSAKEADDAGVDEYWIVLGYGEPCTNKENVKDNDNRKIEKYVRGCGGGSTPPSGSTPVSPTPKPSSTPIPTRTYKCYLDENNDYHWSSSPQANWIVATDSEGHEITNKDLCPPKPGCYQDTKGKYVWGEYSAKPGYVYHPELKTEAACKEDNPYACYKKGDDYVWADSKPDGYVKVELPYEQCENPACYYSESTKKRVWGYYSKVNGYYRLVDENNKDIPYDKCINEACYKCSGDKYKWGDYSNVSGCKLIPSVTDVNQCNNEVPVKSYGVSVSAVIYAFMAILMAFGIGFIYYSTVLKKNN